MAPKRMSIGWGALFGLMAVACLQAQVLPDSLPPDTTITTFLSDTTVADTLTGGKTLVDSWLVPVGMILLSCTGILLLFTVRSK